MPGSTSAILVNRLRLPAFAVGLVVSLAAHASLVAALAIVPTGWRDDPAAATVSRSEPGAPIRVRLAQEAVDRASNAPDVPVAAIEPGPAPSEPEPIDVARAEEPDDGSGVGASRPARDLQLRLSEAWQRLARRVGSIDWSALTEAPAPGRPTPPEAPVPEATGSADADPAPADARRRSAAPSEVASADLPAAGLEPPATPRPRGTSRAVVIVDLPRPDYPRRSVRRHEEGTAVVEIVVGIDGGVRAVRLRTSTGHPRLDDAALAAVRRGRYRPALVDGAATESVVVVPVEFRLTP